MDLLSDARNLKTTEFAIMAIGSDARSARLIQIPNGNAAQ